MTPVLPLIRLSVLAPREAAARILALRLPPAESIALILLVAAVGGLAVGLLTDGEFRIPFEGGDLVLGPLAYAAIVATTLILLSICLALTGRVLGGSGSVEGAMALVGWLQVVDLALQAAGMLIGLLVPPLAGPVAIVILLALAWCLVGFVRELHGLSLGRSIATIVGGTVLLGLALAFLLGLVSPLVTPVA